MLVNQLTPAQIRKRLGGEGLLIETGPFNCRLRSDIAEISQELAILYANHPLLVGDEFIDFHVSVLAGRGLRRWLRPQARFSVDEVEPFTPLPRAQALPMMEWGLNWCITAYSHHVLILHAAAVAKNGRALILPAPPGSGKSTLCAAMVNRGWRLLSDELTVIRLDTGEIQGLARPINLKNASIQVIAQFAPEAYLTKPVHDTSKGTVSLMAPPAESVRQMGASAWPRWVILPRYRVGADTVLKDLPTGAAFMQLADNAMNYHILGPSGFSAVGDLVDRCRHYSFEYSDLNEAIALFDGLAEAA